MTLVRRQNSKQKQEQQEAAALMAKRILARRDLTSFAEYVLRDPNGDPIKAAPIHQSWVQHFYYCWQIGKAGVVLAPYAHGKTQWLALALPLWLLGQNPNLRIMMVSSAEDIAAKRLQKIQEYIEHCPEYQEVYPHVKRDRSKPWNNHVMNVVRTGADGGLTGSVDYSIAAYGYTSSEGQGSRADVLIFDDVCDEKNSRLSAAARQNLISLVSNQWISRTANAPPVKTREGKVLSRTAMICTIGTRFHQEDLYGFWMDAPDGFCTLVQGVSDSMGYLDCEIIGALEKPRHPLLDQWGNWIPLDEPHDEQASAHN